METRLSERQHQILAFIMDKQEEGWTPSVREIGQAVGLRSSAAVQKQLMSLESTGHIRRLHGKARSIQILKPLSPEGEEFHVPILGEIAAGTPLLADENIEGYLSLVDETILLKGGTFFALKVRGDSMIEAGILSGDHVVVRQQPTAENGDIVAALLENEATVKRFFKASDHIQLRPANSKMEPIITREVQILGKVVSVIRQM